MEQMLMEVAKQVPSLAVLCGLVIVFVRDRRAGSIQTDAAFVKRDETAREIVDTHAESLKQRDEMIKEIATQSNECHTRCAESIAASAEVIRQNTSALQKAQERLIALDRLNANERT